MNNLTIEHRYVLDEILVSDDKKSAYLLGFLTRKLTHIEYKNLEKTPFLNKQSLKQQISQKQTTFDI